MYYVMWINESDIDESTFGGGVAYEVESLRDAKAIAKHFTEMGHPCRVENEFGEVEWEPEVE